MGLKSKARLNFEKVQVKRLTCLEVSEYNEIGNFAPNFWPAASIPSNDHLQSKTFFVVEKLQVKRLS